MQLAPLMLALSAGLAVATRGPPVLLTRARSEIPKASVQPVLAVPPPRWNGGLEPTMPPVQLPILTTTPAPTPRMLGVPQPGHFAEMLPFMADAQPEMMVKERCRGMLNKVLERSFYDPPLTLKLLPRCLWPEDQCRALQSDLVARLPKVAGKSAPAAQAAATMAQGGDGVYGWCDTMWNMARGNRINRLKIAAGVAGAAA